ncbi:MAG: response regulator [Oscillospiraceae bacterium]
MYKMIIVDDEQFTRQGIIESVNWELMDIDIVGEASNGLEAMLLIHDTSPDIIICDIRMPKLDGISLINEVKPSHPNLQVIFLSGHSDKEYLKHAIKLSAIDYIFKPFQLHELISSIENAKKNCQQKNTKSVEKDVALELLNYQSSDANSPIFKDLPIDLHGNLICLIIKLNTSAIKSLSTKYDNSFDARIIAEHFYNAFRTSADKIFTHKFIMSCVGAGYVIHANVNEDFPRQMSISWLKEFFDTIEEGKNSISIGISSVCHCPEELHECYCQARDAVNANFLVGYGKLVFYKNLSTEEFVPFIQLQKNFYDNITNNNFTGATNYLEDYISYMQRCRPADIPIIKDVLASIAFWLVEQVKAFPNKNKNYITDIINYAPDILTIQQYLISQIEKYVNNISNLDNKGRILLEVEQYILKNYDKELSIKAIAQKVFITPNYLCYLYKSKTGKTINQFILETKMEKAQKMICDTNKKLGDISDALGYTNQNYFTRTFTKYFGMSPRAYRNKHGQSWIEYYDHEVEE